MKSAKQVMYESGACEIGLALIYIEHERQMCDAMHRKDEVETARQEGIMHGILTATHLLGIKDFYGKTITDLRFAIQEERKEREKDGGL